MQKILILRFSSIGDIVLTTPLVRCLKKQLPDTEVHYFTKTAYAPILEANPYITQVHVLDAPLLQKTLALKQMGFDYIIDLHNNLRTRVIKSMLDIPSASFDKLNFEKWLMVNWRVNVLPKKHIVDRYFETSKNLGVITDGEGLNYFIPEETSLGFTLPTTFLALAIGAQHATKRMPVEKLTALCRELHLPVLLLGGKEDYETGELIQSNCTNEVINLCGKLSLHQSALIIKNAYKVITHDTGLMHIAAAFKKEIISIWGNTIPAFGMYPYYGKYNVQQTQFEVKDLNCRPCSKIGFNACPQKHFNCMNLQNTKEMAEQAKAWVY